MILNKLHERNHFQGSIAFRSKQQGEKTTRESSLIFNSFAGRDFSMLFFFKGDREPVLAVIINRHDFELLKNNRSLTGAVAL
ncbi:MULTISPECIES: hypothetical protein [Cytobacillus]|uniref:Uncharacterized protein n=1 Tax=Cytobacillus oceanisediminis TaxID=665099 RepID=A0ABX3CR26_9BACI|nr:hypothetical protein [Cytobacillus oceanisediminis]MDK7665951.1 hypothetical protein [Cytobacillus oceanisediminis]OHX46808.1 hypothetical protein BBV17_21460 [Cytobacillus oceanisediminis]